MNPILIGLKEEKREASKLIKTYERRLRSLPRGTFFARKVGDGIYGYITHSAGGKVRQKYIGKMTSEQIRKQKEFSSQKKKLKSLIKQAQWQLRFLERALIHARKKS